MDGSFLIACTVIYGARGMDPRGHIEVEYFPLVVEEIVQLNPCNLGFALVPELKLLNSINVFSLF